MISTPIQTRWMDMDPFAHVSNSVFVAYLEIGRVDYCKRRLNVKGIFDVPFILARIEIDLKKSIEIHHQVEVQTSVIRIGNKSWDFQSKIIETNTKEIFAVAKTVQVAFDHVNKSSIPIPHNVRLILEEDLKEFQSRH
ncbi:thioesterase family protein [Leptospira interrogans]|uniref:Thioesterase family protein n=9 Tax=Leptospira interrogans TaxID=173 RepID=M3H5K3_LEPIR|nr:MULTISPECIES: thioesterase family protein [Leptospira]APH43060.1 Thioesterase family protein [Leptospira interrogans serovar Copenhageni/Icterohaemorrhagiae]EMG07995.1 thioesterase family protein [Leptospira interrogans serovar Grippotyphosa str. LT2186]EMG22091.1 thioesterase family protein [Leptospira interrogans serovar Copenhageni str. LT2050]EMM82464.1 thioesterase family protein [Leptospira interrogans str. 2006001854]EMM93513.1 thioesterase family protein [Leptospira interrogans sero